MRTTGCEWNPAEGRPSFTDEPAHAEATVIVGSALNFFLCAECARLPFFKKLRKRRQIKAEAV